MPSRTQANFHCHCDLCDGAGPPEAYAEAALARNFSRLGFSSHAPLPFPVPWCLGGRGANGVDGGDEALASYERRIGALRRAYEGRLRILCGLEVDFIEGLIGPADAAFARFDYRIGSVHFLKVGGEIWPMDSTAEEFAAGLARLFGGDPYALAEAYYDAVRRMLIDSKPDIVGHLDLVKKFNRGGRFFDETDPRYLALVERALGAVAASGAVLELNTGGMARGRTDEPYPSPRFLPRCRELGIPMLPASDCHTPEAVDYGFTDAYALLRAAGFERIAKKPNDRFIVFS